MKKTLIKLIPGMVVFLFLQACMNDEELPAPELPDYTLVFWTSVGDGEILRAVYENEELLWKETLFGPVKGLGAPSAVVADADDQMIYWTDPGTRQLLRGPWDGDGNPEVLYTTPTNSEGPVELVLDTKNQQLYWTQPFEDLILKAPANGNGPVDTLFTVKDGINGTWGIGLAITTGYLYWIEYLDNELWRASLNTEEVPELLYTGGSGFLNPYGIAINESTNELFIADNPPPGAGQPDRIMKGSLDGTKKLETIYDLEDGVDNAYNISINQSTGELYWHNQLTNGSIYKGSLDGKSVPELLLNGIYIGQGLHVTCIHYLNEHPNE